MGSAGEHNSALFRPFFSSLGILLTGTSMFSDEESDFEVSLSPSPAKPPKKLTKVATKPKAILGDRDVNAEAAPQSKKVAKSAKKIEDEYVKMDPREHVLLRPDMYIGSVQKISEPIWVYEEGRGACSTVRSHHVVRSPPATCAFPGIYSPCSF